MTTDPRFAGETSLLVAEETRRPHLAPKTPEELSSIVSLFASSDKWIDKVRLCSSHRWYERLYDGPDHDIWLISWLPGQSTGFHDHGSSSGAFVVATGTLEEHRPGEAAQTVYPGAPRAFGPDFTHDVRNVSIAPAVSIHAYSPPLNAMNEYDLEDTRLVPRESAQRESEMPNLIWPWQTVKPGEGPAVAGIEQVLSAARGQLKRMTPQEANEAVAESKAMLVDIRPEGQRAVEGSIPRALIVERNVLEWRLDPASNARLPIAKDYDLQLIIFCSEGYASSLAAADLQKIGLYHTTDMVGGFRAWREAGLPALASTRGY